MLEQEDNLHIYIVYIGFFVYYTSNRQTIFVLYT